MLAVALTAALPFVQPDDTRESEVKAAYLYNFAKYISWSARTPAQSDSFKICVLADRSFQGHLDEIIAGEVIEGLPVVRVVPASVSETRACHILFVSRGEGARAQRLVDAVRDDPVLVVGDAPDFLSRGGAIAFVRDGARLRFDVNMEETRRSKLVVSSRLLRVARRVLNPENRDETRRPPIASRVSAPKGGPSWGFQARPRASR